MIFFFINNSIFGNFLDCVIWILNFFFFYLNIKFFFLQYFDIRLFLVAILTLHSFLALFRLCPSAGQKSHTGLRVSKLKKELYIYNHRKYTRFSIVESIFSCTLSIDASCEFGYGLLFAQLGSHTRRVDV